MRTVRGMVISLLVAALLLAVLALPGCWNQREPQNQAIILAVGLDYDEAGGLYEVLVEIAIPSALAGPEGGAEGGGDQPVSQLLSARGRTVFEALRSLGTLSPRQLYWGHSELVIFSEALSRHGLANILDFFERERHSRVTNRPLVTDDELKKLLKVKLPLEQTAGIGLVAQIDNSELESAMIPTGDLRQLMMRLSQPGIELFLPRIRISAQGDDAAGSMEGEEGGGEEDADSEQPPPTAVETEGGAAFRDDRMAGWLGVDATRGWLWITANVNRATEVLPCPDCDGFISVEIIHYESSIKPLFEAGRPKIIVTLSGDSRIQDLNCKHPFDAEREEIIPVLNSRIAEAIRAKMQAAVNEARELGSDIFGFGREFYRRAPREWSRMEQNWPRLFADELVVEFQVEINLRRVGLTIDPVRVR